MFKSCRRSRESQKSLGDNPPDLAYGTIIEFVVCLDPPTRATPQGLKLRWATEDGEPQIVSPSNLLIALHLLGIALHMLCFGFWKTNMMISSSVTHLFLRLIHIIISSTSSLQCDWALRWHRRDSWPSATSL